MQTEVVRAVSVEQQVSIVRRETGIVLPRLTGGKKQFFSDLLGDRKSLGDVGCILPEPQFGLVFPTVAEVLTSTQGPGDSASRSNWVSTQLVEFGLSGSKATQPVQSLSGGEQMLLTFAKLFNLADQLKKLVACSPLHPLDPSRYLYWDKLHHAFSVRKKAVTVILLDGESLDANPSTLGLDASASSANQGKDLHGPQWELTVSDPVLEFPEIQFPTHHPAFALSYTSDGSVLQLSSPTFASGDNGIGKSAFCKALAGLGKIIGGQLSVVAPNGSGRARLLLQEADEQLFGRSIMEHLQWVFRYDGEKAKLAHAIYADIENKLRAFVKGFLGYATSLGDSGAPSTELQAKIVLAAERIASKPSLLILDEPSRKLCKPLAVELIAAICEQAHKQNVPVLIISHQTDWWTGIAQSRLLFERLPNGATKIKLVEGP